MPEGHTIERLAREHEKLFQASTLSFDSPQGRFAADAELISGRRLIDVVAIGKHSLHRLRLDDAPPRHDLWLHVHLGLYGKWRSGPLPLPDVVGQVRLRLWNTESWAQLRGAIVSEVLDAAQVKALKLRLGEDPLKSKLSGTTAYERIARSTRPIGLLLMDQTVLAGVGNVYRAEILYRQRINPHRPGKLVTPDEWALLWADLMKLMRAGVRLGRIVTTDAKDRGRRTGAALAGDAHYVYRRHGLPCRVCGTEILMEELAGRRLYWCPVCQAV